MTDTAAQVRVAGVGMIPFRKPGAGESYPAMAERAARAALDDAGLPYEAVRQAYAGYVYGDSAAGQAALYRLGLSGIPVVNVNNNCATGSSALWLARQAVASGAADCVLALGFEQMRPGALASVWDDRPDPLGRFLDHMTHSQDMTNGHQSRPSCSEAPESPTPTSTASIPPPSPRSR